MAVALALPESARLAANDQRPPTPSSQRREGIDASLIQLSNVNKAPLIVISKDLDIERISASIEYQIHQFVSGVKDFSPAAQVSDSQKRLLDLFTALGDAKLIILEQDVIESIPAKTVSHLMRQRIFLVLKEKPEMIIHPGKLTLNGTDTSPLMLASSICAQIIGLVQTESALLHSRQGMN